MRELGTAGVSCQYYPRAWISNFELVENDRAIRSKIIADGGLTSVSTLIRRYIALIVRVLAKQKIKFYILYALWFSLDVRYLSAHFIFLVRFYVTNNYKRCSRKLPNAMSPREFDFTSKEIRFLYVPSYLPSTFQTRTRPTKSKSLASKVAKGCSNVRRSRKPPPLPPSLPSTLTPLAFPIPDGIAIGEKIKASDCEYVCWEVRIATGASLYTIPNRSARCVTREVAKMLPVPTSCKELRELLRVSSCSLSRYVVRGIGCYVTPDSYAGIVWSALCQTKNGKGFTDIRII